MRKPPPPHAVPHMRNGSYRARAGIAHPFTSERALALLPSMPQLANALALLLLRWNITWELVRARGTVGDCG